MSNRKTVIAFVRHGEYQQLDNTPSASQPFALTTEGQEQAKIAGKALNQFAIEQKLSIFQTLYSSNLLRAWQTTQEIGEQLQLNVSPQISCHAQLNERSVGAVANLALEQIDNLLEQDPRYQKPDFNWKSDSHFCLPFDGAESLMQAGERVSSFLNKLASKQFEEDCLIIVVGHGACFRHAVHQMGILQFEEIAQLSMYHAQPIYLQFDQKQQAWEKIAGQWKQRSSSIKENLD